MRSGLLAVVTAWFTACAPATGLQFEIDGSGDPTASEVMVYVGKGDGDSASIAAELRTPSASHAGRFWPFGLDPERFQLTATERTATLSFAPGGDSTKVTVVAVGLTNGAPSSVATQAVTRIRTDLVEVWTLTLEPIKADVDTTTGRAVQRWGEEPGDHTCVQAVDRSAADPELRNLFIGKGGDRDCDGHRRLLADGSPNPAECDDDWHDATVKPSIDTLSCMQEYVQPALPELCILGGRQCVDGGSATNEGCSHALPFCAPGGLCGACARDATPDERFRCALETDPRSTSNTPISFIQCTIEINTTNGRRALCPTRLRVTPPNPATQLVCTGTPRYHSRDPATGWTSTAKIGGLSVAFSLDGTVPGCSLDVVPTEVAGQSIASNGFSEHGLFAATVGTNRGVVSPIVFAFEDTMLCSVTQRDCTPIGFFDANETINKCLQVAP